MQILPVLDVMNGQVVRGIGGRRQEYLPIVSQLTGATDPLRVANAFREQFGLDELYVADLDAISGAIPAYPVFTNLHEEGFRLWVDAGVGEGLKVAETLAGIGFRHCCRTGNSARPDRSRGTDRPPLGPANRFSLDAKNGKPLGAVEAWTSPDVWAIAQQAVAQGVGRLLVLDLAAVGENKGSSTENLCERLRSSYPDLEISTGGGIRGMDDLRRLHEKGVEKVLVASALHDARLTARDVEEVHPGELREAGFQPAGTWPVGNRPTCTRLQARNSQVAAWPTFSSTSTRNSAGTKLWCLCKSPRSRSAI